MIPKFRAFDKKYKKIMKVNEINFEKSSVWIESDSGDHENRHTLTRGFDEVVLMQSTGLHDKNGVEIYEGDILKLHAIFLAPDDKIGYIEYSPKYGYSIIFEGNRLYRQEYWASTNKLNYEVIGNIYENPELLEGHEK